MRLGVLDQTPIISGHTPAQALAETVALAAGGGPARVLTATGSPSTMRSPRSPIPARRFCSRASRPRPRRIRVGTGGVLLPYYSPLKVAEVFRMLEALFPGRIDLGIGRAPGGDQTPRRRSRAGHYTGADDFPRAGAGSRRVPRRRDCPPGIRSPGSRRSRTGDTRRRSGCSARRTTAARWPPNSGCASPSPISSAPRAATP